jgi:hypothetical protein
VLKPALFLHVAAPLVRFAPIGASRFPERWEVGEYRGSMRLFGFLPIGWQAIVIQFPDDREGPLVLTDHGYGPMLRQWEHRIEVHAMEGGGTRYIDRLKMDAGFFTPVARLMVAQFFKHRQGRLKKLDQTGFRELSDEV